MTGGPRELVVGVMGVAGLIFFLLGLFTESYGFGVGLVIGIAFWSLSGLLARYWDVPKWNAHQR